MIDMIMGTYDNIMCGWLFSGVYSQNHKYLPIFFVKKKKKEIAQYPPSIYMMMYLHYYNSFEKSFYIFCTIKIL